MNNPPAEAATPSSPAGLQLGAALCVCLVLILPMRGAFGTTTYGGMYAWIFGAFALMVVMGLLIGRIGVPDGAWLAVTAGGLFALLAPIGMWLVVAIGDPGDAGSVAVLVGAPAAGLASLGAVAAIRLWPELVAVIGVASAMIGLITAASAGEPAWVAIDDARDDAADIAAFEESGLEPYLPEIGDLSASFDGTTRVVGGPPTGYSLRYDDGSEGYSSEHITVQVTTNTEPYLCTPLEGSVECDEHDGYVVRTQGGVVDQVMVEGTVALVADVSTAGSSFPSVDEVGEALVDATDYDTRAEVEWQDILDLRD